MTRLVSADEARGDISRESWGPTWAEDLQHTVVTQAEQIAAAIEIHKAVSEDGGSAWCLDCGGMYPCLTVRALGVTA